ncbi:MAG: universal stress protein [Streptosporangiaceae bacterium]
MPGIIVGVDGSGHSQRALEWAVRQAALQQVPLTVLTVNPVATEAWTGNPVIYPPDAAKQETFRQAAEEATQKAVSELGDTKPPSVTITAVSGQAAPALIAASQDADMVVVGSRGSGGFASLMLGSVSMQLVHHSHCPVVVIPGPR